MTSAFFSKRRPSLPVPVAGMTIGGQAPVLIQSMTDTETADVDATVAQVLDLAEAGSEAVRITVNTREAARAVPEIAERLYVRDCRVPLIGDFHFNGHQLLSEYPDCARALSKYRINPGNVGGEKSYDANFARMIEIACRLDRAVRIGANGGSLDPRLLAQRMEYNRGLPIPLSENEVMEEALAASVLDSARLAENLGLPPDRIVLSAKLSDLQALVRVYLRLAEECSYPLHLGLTEAGPGSMGLIASSAAIAILLEKGIGDTIRVSLTPSPGQSRCQEVVAARQILQALGLRRFSPQIIACPGCGRTGRNLFQDMVQQIKTRLEENFPGWSRDFKGIENLKIAVMGCVVNGPGESRHADIGLSLPGTGENPKAAVYTAGSLHCLLEGDNLADPFIRIVDQYIRTHFLPRP